MLIEFACTSCQTKLEIDARSAGASVNCPRCQTELIAPPAAPAPGVTVGAFKIERLLGRGAMGQVYLARQLSMQRDVAVKILAPHLMANRNEVDRFLAEVRVAAQLQHPHIVPVYEAGVDQDVYFMAMAYVKGDSLEQRVARDGPMPPPDALAITRKIAGALAYAWNEHRMVHRDVKPGNILLDGAGEPRLTDMGLSKRLTESLGLTLAGEVMGTPNYMSPEQCEGRRDLDFRSDIYSLGMTLYHMLTGQVPFGGSSILDTLRRQATETLADPRTHNRAVSAGTAHVLALMLAKDPQNRPASWEALIADLDRVAAAGEPSHAPPAPGQSMLAGAAARAPSAGPTARRRTIVVRHDGPTTEPAPPQPKSSRPPPQRPRRGVPAELMALGGAAFVAAVAVVAMVLSSRQPAKSRPSPPPVTRAPGPSAPSAAAPTPARAAVRTLAPAPALPTVPPPTAPEPEETVPAATPPVPTATPSLSDEEMERLSDAVAARLLKLDFDGARGLLAETRADASAAPIAAVERIRALVEQASGLPNLVMASFLGDRDKDVAVHLTAGPETLRIERVDGLTVAARRVERTLGGSASIGRTFTYQDLSVAEKLRRLGSDDTPERDLMRGLLMCQARAYGPAAQYFERVGGALGRSLLHVLPGPSSTPAADSTAVSGPASGVGEQAAAEAYGRLLELAGARDRSQPAAEIIRALRAKKRGEMEVVRIRKAAADFRKRYGQSATAQAAAAVLATIESLGTKPLAVDRDAVERAAQAIRKANPGQPEVRCTFAVTADGVDMNLAHNEALRDLAPLAGLPIRRLDLTGSGNVSSLKPLADLPIRSLVLAECPVADLAPLEGLPLEELDLSLVSKQFAVTPTDLRPLAGMPLRKLTLVYRTVADLTPLKGMALSALTILYPGEGLTDIAPLRGMPLETLELRNTGVSDLSPLAGMPLRKLVLSGRAIGNVDPLKGLPLVELRLEDCPRLRDIGALRGMAALTTLCLAGSGVDDIAPLEGLPIQGLNLTGTAVSDLSVLKTLPALRYLQLARCAAVRDLTPLAKCRLLNLQIPRQVENLDCLRRHPTLTLLGYDAGQDRPVAEFWADYDGRRR